MVAEITKSHELAETRLYNIWANMKQRCFNPNANGYKDYGGRGITMYKEWLDPGEFFSWAHSTGYADNLTIDRINVDGNYEPSNCRWVTVKKQNNNRRSNHNITFNGETHNMQEWAEITGIPRSTIKGRLNRGWTIEDTLTKEVT